MPNPSSMAVSDVDIGDHHVVVRRLALGVAGYLRSSHAAKDVVVGTRSVLGTQKQDQD
jgi:hypothetical protein